MTRPTTVTSDAIKNVPEPFPSGHFLIGSTSYPCPVGTYGVDGKTCHPCPFATWSPSTGQTHCGRSFTYSYSASSASQLLYIPYGVTAINVKLWGGGGQGSGGGDISKTSSIRGGGGRGGSYSSCNVSVTMDQNVYVIVGRGGRSLETDGDGASNVEGKRSRQM